MRDTGKCNNPHASKHRIERYTAFRFPAKAAVYRFQFPDSNSLKGHENENNNRPLDRCTVYPQYVGIKKPLDGFSHYIIIGVRMRERFWFKRYLAHVLSH